MVPFLALALVLRQDSPEGLLKRMQDAVRADSKEQVSALFQESDSSNYLLRMASRCGGIKGLRVAVFPSPKGWESKGKYWATFHTWQELEQDHDPIYPVVETPAGLSLGSEIPEWDCGGQIDSIKAEVRLEPDSGTVYVTANVNASIDQKDRALLFRLNDKFSFDYLDNSQPKAGDSSRSLAVPTLDESKVVSAVPDVFRVGSLLAVKFGPRSKFTYSANIGSGAMYSGDRDQITKDYAYITSWWLPSLGRLPFKTEIEVNTPNDWVVASEGERMPSPRGIRGYALHIFKCDVPISYPKVIAGKYVLAAEGKQNGKTLRSYQFAPIDKERAAKDVEWMKKALAFYEQNLGPFPFQSYDCFDGRNYYGIESYSYTVLAPEITTWAVSHEMGHTYFGGLVPCAYVKDTWNEGVTQYVDDVLLHNKGEVAQMAFAQINVPTPLTEMFTPWEGENATYYRGGYVMQMLDAEIGHDKVMAGLRALIKDRVGKETNWQDLRQYFEKSGGQDLKWFWNQWVDNGVFPQVSITSATARHEVGKWITSVTVKQSGTPAPFRLRFGIQLDADTTTTSNQLLTGGEHTFEISTVSKPKKVSINPVRMSLVFVDKPVEVTIGGAVIGISPRTATATTKAAA